MHNRDYDVMCYLSEDDCYEMGAEMRMHRRGQCMFAHQTPYIDYECEGWIDLHDFIVDIKYENNMDSTNNNVF